MDKKRKIIIDCDPGHDDAVAIMLAARNPKLEPGNQIPGTRSRRNKDRSVYFRRIRTGSFHDENRPVSEPQSDRVEAWRPVDFEADP